MDRHQKFTMRVLFFWRLFVDAKNVTNIFVLLQVERAR